MVRPSWYYKGFLLVMPRTPFPDIGGRPAGFFLGRSYTGFCDTGTACNRLLKGGPCKCPSLRITSNSCQAKAPNIQSCLPQEETYHEKPIRQIY